MKGGAKVVVEKHRHEGIFVARGKEDALVTKNMVVGESVYGEKRISVDVRPPASVLFPRPRRDPTDARAKRFSSRRLGFPLPAAVPLSPPVVISSEFQKEARPLRIVRTDQLGCHSSG